LAMASLIIYRLKNYDISYFFSSLLVIFIGLQPHTGEAFFTITNAQWFLGIYLSIYLLTKKSTKTNFLDILALTILCLTGPFIILILPVLGLKLIIENDIRLRKYEYITILICASIQIYFIATSGRIESKNMDPNISNWLQSLWNFISLHRPNNTSLKSNFVSILSVTLAISYIYMITFFKRNLIVKNNTKWLIASYLFLTAIIFYAAGLWASKDNPLISSPLGTHARYYIIPYALIFTSIIFISTYYNKTKIMLFLIFLICLLSTKGKIQKNQFYFDAYSEYAKTQKELIIPINPQGDNYPSWHIKTKNNNPVIAGIRIPLSKAYINNGTLKISSSIAEVSGINTDVQIIFTNKIDCENSKYIGLSIDAWREQSGWSKIFWSSSLDFNDEFSQRRFYNNGHVIMQFAFPNLLEGFYLRFDPMDWVGNAKIFSVEVNCLE